ncbi:hypothetical protein OTU49_011948 [Cherax quadricarinatus]|uniref:Uncharacterized protein n=1 Tax=Cherax quadricarinatus TaxID=27406 RepID=A0AAW0W176_CHEQU
MVMWKILPSVILVGAGVTISLVHSVTSLVYTAVWWITSTIVNQLRVFVVVFLMALWRTPIILLRLIMVLLPLTWKIIHQIIEWILPLAKVCASPIWLLFKWTPMWLITILLCEYNWKILSVLFKVLSLLGQVVILMKPLSVILEMIILQWANYTVVTALPATLTLLCRIILALLRWMFFLTQIIRLTQPCFHVMEKVFLRLLCPFIKETILELVQMVPAFIRAVSFVQRWALLLQHAMLLCLGLALKYGFLLLRATLQVVELKLVSVVLHIVLHVIRIIFRLVLMQFMNVWQLLIILMKVLQRFVICNLMMIGTVVRHMKYVMECVTAGQHRMMMMEEWLLGLLPELLRLVFRAERRILNLLKSVLEQVLQLQQWVLLKLLCWVVAPLVLFILRHILPPILLPVVVVIAPLWLWYHRSNINKETTYGKESNREETVQHSDEAECVE